MQNTPNNTHFSNTLEALQQHQNSSLTAPIPTALQTYLTQLNTVIKPYLIAQGVIPTPINAREALAMLTFTYVTHAPEMAKTIDSYVATPDNFRGYRVPLRLFIPQGVPVPNPAAPVALPKLPVLIYFHGGGGMAGSVSVYDKIYKKLAAATGCIVVAPEYRLSPENLYPAGIDDAHTVLKFLSETLAMVGYASHRDELPCIIAGDSAGGAITATLVQDWLAGKVKTPVTIVQQILIYAALDYTVSPEQHASLRENAVGYLLETSKVQWYYDNYFHAHDDREIASPYWTDLQMLASHSDKPLPATLNITAGYCPLRDEGIGYHEQLLKAGFASEWLHFSDMVHTFINLENLCPNACDTLYQMVGKFVKSSVHPKI